MHFDQIKTRIERLNSCISIDKILDNCAAAGHLISVSSSGWHGINIGTLPGVASCTILLLRNWWAVSVQQKDAKKSIHLLIQIMTNHLRAAGLQQLKFNQLQ